MPFLSKILAALHIPAGTAAAKAAPFALGGLIVATVATLILFACNIFFEVTMAVTGGIAFVEAFIVATLGSIAEIILVLSIMAIGLGILTQSASKEMGMKIIGYGIGGIVVGIVFMMPAQCFPYGHDPQTNIVRYAGELEGSSLVSYDIAQHFQGRTSIFLSAPVSANGHCYLALNRLGCTSLTPEELTAQTEQNLGAVFPINVHGANNTAVVNGETLWLGVLPLTGDNPVRCEVDSQNAHEFKLIAEEGHLLEGTACHGFVQDTTGSIWLFQYGYGPKPVPGMPSQPAGTPARTSETAVSQLANYPIAKKMWEHMAENAIIHFNVNTASGCRAVPGTPRKTHSAKT